MKIILASSLFASISCKSGDKIDSRNVYLLNENVKIVDFNQSLFRNCIKFLDDNSSAKIICSDNVLKKNDISITYNSTERDVLMHVQNLITIVNEEYSLDWTCKVADGVIYIKDE